MDDQNTSISNAVSSDQFALGKKWFWIGIAVALTSVNVVVGLIYGIALAVEKEHRKEGGIIIAVSIVWFLFCVLFLYMKVKVK